MAMSGLSGMLLLMPGMAMAQRSGSTTEVRTPEAQRFRAYLDEDWRRWMVEYPEMATAVGFPGQNRRWQDDSPEGIERRKQHLRESLARLHTFLRANLPAGEQLNYDLYRELLEIAVEGLQYDDDPFPFRDVVPHSLAMPVSQIEGIQQDAEHTLAVMPRQTVADYEDILARLEALPKAVEQQKALLEAGLKNKKTPPRITLRDLPKQIDDLVPANALASPLLPAFGEWPLNFPQGERDRLTERAKVIYSGQVVPAFRRLREYLAEKYIPACREAIAASELPDGPAAYSFHVRWQTTTDLTPQQIHLIGLAEVKRIRAEMDKLIASTGFPGGFRDFTEFLRTDARFYYADEDSLVDGYRIIAKRIDPELARLFGKLPRLPYGVAPVPAFEAPSQTTAYYRPGSPEAGRPGTYFANTFDLKSRPKWEMEALTMHEAVPGHHLQISLAQELEDAPEFRKHIGYSAFVEGWALYAESLGEELGFYKDPYAKFGQLSYEMWRAIRLVVDTGMHSMGWSREQAIAFFRENTGKADQDIIVEVDRYIVWPGQALAYKIGQLKIRALRREAETKLGARFNVRAFHDAVLANGALPLGLLEARMTRWIEQQEAAAGHAGPIPSSPSPQ